MRATESMKWKQWKIVMELTIGPLSAYVLRFSVPRLETELQSVEYKNFLIRLARVGCKKNDSRARRFRDFSPAALALAPPSLIEQCLKGVNYFKTKAKRLGQIAALLLTKHAGRVPATFDELTALPGVGAKVANLVLSVTFGKDAGMVVDTHVHRVARRLGWSDGNVPEKTRKDLEQFMSSEIREHVTIRLIAFGQEICRPQYPKCDSCPVAREQLCPTYARRLHGGREPLTGTFFPSLRPSPKSRKRIFIEIDDAWTLREAAKNWLNYCSDCS